MVTKLRNAWEYLLVAVISLIVIVLGYGALAFFWALGVFFRIGRRR